jgi:peptidylprolyl isomerase
MLSFALLILGACRGSADSGASARVTTPSGLTYLDEQVGRGDPIHAGQTAVVHFTGWVEDRGHTGRRFASSEDSGEPFVFRLGAGEVIPGWEEGVAGMRPGGRRRLIVPPALVGYGNRDLGDTIPANATLIFDISLVEVRP